jgi:hypothetical protein
LKEKEEEKEGWESQRRNKRYKIKSKGEFWRYKFHLLQNLED